MSNFRRIFFSFSLLLLLSTYMFAAQPLPSLGEPSFSPDGSELAFVSGGDIWTVPAAGGVARLLIAHPATESRPLYSPDGKFLAFVSTRTGNGDIYVLELASGNLKRLTFDDAFEQLDSWSADGRWIYFSSAAHDISGMNDIYRVSIDGGTPMPVSSERYVNEFHSAPSPDGASLVFASRGMANSQWWRNGHSHIDETEIWKLRNGAYERLLTGGAKQMWPMWSPDGKTIYFVSDRTDHENIWALGQDGKTRQITKFTSGRVLWPSISRDGRFIAFERDFGIWVVNTADGKPLPLKIELRGSPASAGVEHRRISDQFREMALSPDGKKLVFTARGDIFAAPAKDGGEGIRVTNTPAREAQLTWSPDNHCIAYISDRDGREHIFVYDFNNDKEMQITSGTHEEVSPLFSPDGKMLAFLRDRNSLVVYDLVGKKETVLASGLLLGARPPMGAEHSFDWSPDSRWIAYTAHGDRMFRNAFVVKVDGSARGQVSFVANVFTDSISWSPDGKYLLMETGQRTEPGQIARIDLLQRLPKFQEDKFRELFKEEKNGPKTEPKPEVKPEAQNPETQPAETPKADTKSEPTKAEDRKGPKARPTEVVFEGIRRRLNLMPLELDASSPVISPDGKWLAFTADVAGESNIYIYSLDELSKEPAIARQLTATRGGKSAIQFTPDSKEIYYLDNGRISAVTIEMPKSHPVPVTAEMDVDFAREKTEAFEQGWRWLRDSFFDANMNGVDWNRTHDEYAPRVAAARTGDEMRRIMSLMIGELNASHMGIGGPMEERRVESGRLAVSFDAGEYAKAGKLRISHVVPLGPAAIAGIKEGDYILSVDGTPVGPTTDFDSLLLHRIGHKTAVVLSTNGSGTNPRIVSVKPVDIGAEKGLLYREWVENNRAYVDKISGGKLGYVHMIDMGMGSLQQLFMDLDSENHRRLGVVIDIRNNNGGFVNAYALDVLSRRGYLTMTGRGLLPVPARSVLGQRSLELPTILVTNQHSLSDAEDFTEGYRTLGLGKVVGEPTAGWIIYTSNYPLIDGSSLRIPFMRVTDHEGRDMEMHPRAVDVETERSLGESGRGTDSQLDIAVKELLKQIDQQQKRPALVPAAAR